MNELDIFYYENLKQLGFSSKVHDSEKLDKHLCFKSSSNYSVLQRNWPSPFLIANLCGQFYGELPSSLIIVTKRHSEKYYSMGSKHGMAYK